MKQGVVWGQWRSRPSPESFTSSKVIITRGVHNEVAVCVMLATTLLNKQLTAKNKQLKNQHPLLNRMRCVCVRVHVEEECSHT